jgi:hypothetical protein
MFKATKATASDNIIQCASCSQRGIGIPDLNTLLFTVDWLKDTAILERYVI